MTHSTPSAPETAEPASALIGRLMELLGKATPRPWFCGPLQAEDEYGAPGGVEIGPYDLAERYGTRSDYTTENFNSYYESNIATVSGQNQDPEAVAALIVAAVNELPVLLSLLTTQAAEIARLSERVERAEIGPDTDGPVNFYERDFYPLSSFSAFSILWEVSPLEGLMRFDTSEAAYHFEKFIKRGRVPTLEQRQIAHEIRRAPSAHEAFKIAERNKHLRRDDWDDIKIDVMRRIIRAKADQHEYVRRKLLATGERLLIEGSWRDNFWGVGPNGDGQNMLGKLWMELRADFRAAADFLGETK